MDEVLNIEYLWDIDFNLKIWFSFGDNELNFNGGEYYFKTKHLNMFDCSREVEIINYLDFMDIPIVNKT